MGSSSSTGIPPITTLAGREHLERTGHALLLEHSPSPNRVPAMTAAELDRELDDYMSNNPTPRSIHDPTIGHHRISTRAPHGYIYCGLPHLGSNLHLSDISQPYARSSYVGPLPATRRTILQANCRSAVLPRPNMQETLRESLRILIAGPFKFLEKYCQIDKLSNADCPPTGVLSPASENWRPIPKLNGRNELPEFYYTNQTGLDRMRLTFRAEHSNTGDLSITRGSKLAETIDPRNLVGEQEAQNGDGPGRMDLATSPRNHRAANERS